MKKKEFIQLDIPFEELEFAPSESKSPDQFSARERKKNRPVEDKEKTYLTNKKVEISE